MAHHEKPVENHPLIGHKVRGYKLLRVMADGSIAPLFIGAKLRLAPGVTYEAEDRPTKGYAHRPGWHTFSQPVGPHLSKAPKAGAPRQWWEVVITVSAVYDRPECQGGVWYLGSDLTLIRPIAAPGELSPMEAELQSLVEA